jgi:hypothetical protein
MTLWLWMSQKNETRYATGGHGGPVGIEEDISQWINPPDEIYYTSQSA